MMNPILNFGGFGGLAPHKKGGFGGAEPPHKKKKKRIKVVGSVASPRLWWRRVCGASLLMLEKSRNFQYSLNLCLGANALIKML